MTRGPSSNGRALDRYLEGAGSIPVGSPFTAASRSMHDVAQRFADNLAEPLRTYVLRALAELVAEHRVPMLYLSSLSPWVTIDQLPGPTLVVWINSGDVYELDDKGAVGEEPVLRGATDGS